MLGYTVILFVFFFILYFVTKHERTFRGDVGYVICYNWKPLKFLHVIAVCLIAGLSTTSIGVGLAFLCAPLLESLDFPVEISDHTPLFIELTVRTITTIQFIIVDASEWRFMLYFAAWVVPGALIGTVIIHPLTKSHYRTTIMLSIASLILGIACIAIVVVDSLRIADEVRSGNPLFDFQGYCLDEEEEHHELFKYFFYSH